MTTFGRRLRAARVASGMTQRSFAYSRPVQEALLVEVEKVLMRAAMHMEAAAQRLRLQAGALEATGGETRQTLARVRLALTGTTLVPYEDGDELPAERNAGHQAQRAG